MFFCPRYQDTQQMCSPVLRNVLCPAAVPVLLPYKPLGSENMFYVPQTEAQLSPIRSDTTIESSHTGRTTHTPLRGGTVP